MKNADLPELLVKWKRESADAVHYSLKDLYIDIASVVIRQHGIKRLSTREIASYSGYSPAMLYTRFDGLDELILYVQSAALRRLAVELEISASRIEGRRDPRPAIRLVLRFIVDNRNISGSFIDVCLRRDASWPDWYARELAESAKRITQIFVETLGEPSEVVRNRLFAFVGIVVGAVALGKDADGAASELSREEEERIVDLFMSAELGRFVGSKVAC